MLPDNETLKARARLLRDVRAFFDARDFVEVETPVRIAAPAPECHIDCPPVATGGFLRASPELQMKKLLAAGMDKIYQMGPCFRDGEKGARHNPEFTMLEWYRRDADYSDVRRDLEALLTCLRLIGSPRGFAARDDGINARHCESRSDAAIQTLSVREAYRRFAGWDPWTAWDQDRFDFDMATKIEPAIKALGGGVFLADYPVQAASLAVLRGDVAERWEFYWDGVELANCFTELCDADEQRRRFESARAERAALGEADYPLDEDFFNALPRIGSAAGVALGVDRLAMVLAGVPDIARVRVV